MKKLIAILVTLVVLLSVVVGGLIWWQVGKNQSLSTDKVAEIAKKSSNSIPEKSLKTSKVKLYMIALGEGGKSGEMIGCDDSLMEISYDLTGPDLLADTYLYLLNQHSRDYGESGLYNALGQATLTLRSAKVDENGVAHVDLSGSLNLAGVCDIPRVRAQLEKPALQFDGVKSVEVTINGQALSSVLSLK
jgi:hypothetical protein